MPPLPPNLITIIVMARPDFTAAGSLSFDELTERAVVLVDADEEMLYELIQARRSAGLTQRALAELLGISQPAVAKFERHDSDPRLSTIRKYALCVGAHVRHEVVPAEEHDPLLAWDGEVPIAMPVLHSVSEGPPLIEMDLVDADYTQYGRAA